MAPSLLNLCLTDGKTLVASRYVNHPTAKPASLYFTSGSDFSVSESGKMILGKNDRQDHVVILASEPITDS
ncbi:MAG: hypothetical protein MI867_12735, partial [Pseudomonadales bacterium]|nr:hypothetical protein [Pseudomonadales bacterium]